MQAAWKELGITTTIKPQEWAQFLEFIGPPPDKSVDVYRYGWIGDYVDAINFLELWTCESGNNSTNYCNPELDQLVEKARATPDNDARYALYAQIEEMLLGEDGAVPLAPIYWYTVVVPGATVGQGDVLREPPRAGRPTRRRSRRELSKQRGIGRRLSRPIPFRIDHCGVKEGRS